MNEAGCLLIGFLLRPFHRLMERGKEEESRNRLITSSRAY